MKTHPLNFFYFCPHCGSERYVIKSAKSKKCLQCGFEYFINASASVAGFVVNERNELLLCRRAFEPAQDTWDLPGGFVDLDETAEQALSRELMEELGIQPTAIHYLFSLPNEYLYSRFNVHTLDLFFKVQAKNLDKLTCSDDVCELKFVPINEVKTTEIGLSSIQKAVNMFLKQPKYFFDIFA